MNDKETRSLVTDTNIIQKAQIKCPKCFVLFSIPEPQVPRDVRCGKCKFTFQVGAEKISVFYSSDTKDILSKDTVAANPPKKVEPETVDGENKTFQVNSTFVLNETLLASEQHNLRSFLKLKGLTPKAMLSQSTTFDSENEESTKYIYGKEIGRGGMGAIISTHDVDTRRNIVTKVLLRTASKKALLRFIEEAQITAQLEHPNIVPIYDIGVNKEGNIYYTMQHVKGDSLQEVIDKSDAEFQINNSDQFHSRFLHILVDVSNAVAFAHSKKVIHRDLKPNNIMIGEYGEVILMDFGLAKILNNEDPDDVEELIDVITSTRTEFNEMITLEGEIAGTPKYMAPEQANGDIKWQDEQTDIYALGAILFACIAKKAPIPGNSIHEILQNVIEGRKHPLPGSTPPELVAIINKAMAVEKINRYKTVKDFSNDLKLYLQGYSISAKEDNFKEICIKLIKRNKQAFLISSIALSIMLVLGILAIQQIIQKKEEAENNLSKFQLAQKMASQEKIGKEKLQNEKIKSWKTFYQEPFNDLKYHAIPNRAMDYGFGSWGVHKGRANHETVEVWNIPDLLKNKIWFEKNEIHLSGPSNCYVYLNKNLYGNFRFETSTTYISGSIPELTIYIAGTLEKQDLDGYSLVIGSKLKFQKKGNTIFEQDLVEPLQVNKKQHILFEKNGNLITVFLNDLTHPFFQWEDPEPIYGEKNAFCGFYVWNGEISFDSLCITKQTWAKQNSPADFVDRLRKIGQDQLAIEEYKEIIFSTDDLLEKTEALFEMGTTYKHLGSNLEANEIFTSFVEKNNSDKFQFEIPFDKADKFIKKSFVFLFLISLDENYMQLSQNLDKWPLPLEKCYKDVISQCKNDDSMEIIFNYIVTKFIKKNMTKEEHVKITRLLKLLINNMNQSSAQTCNKTLAELLFNFSLNYNNSKDFTIAEFLITEAINIKPKDDKYLMQRGAYFINYHTDNASIQLGLKDFYNSMEINASNLLNYFNLYSYFLKKKNFEDAIIVLKKGLKITPNSFDLNNLLACTYLASGKFDQFNEIIKAQIIRSPYNPATIWLVIESYYLRQMNNELQSIINNGLNGIKLDPETTIIIQGLILLNTNKTKEGLDVFITLTTNSNDRLHKFLLARAYNKNKEYQKSIDVLLKITEKYRFEYYELYLFDENCEKLK